MKMRKLLFLLLAVSVAFGSTAFANGDYIGPAYRLDEGGGCSVYSPSEGWDYDGTYFVQFSNGKTGHASFKCKMELVAGDPVLYYSEYDSGGYPLDTLGYPGAMCYTTLEINGEKGMWTAQCFGAWDDGE
jgi:hypothetical protein